MIVQTDDFGEFDIGDLEGEALAEAYADSKAYCDHLEAVFGRYGRTLARYGLDFANGGQFLVVADRELAVRWFGKPAVERIEDAEEIEG